MMDGLIELNNAPENSIGVHNPATGAIEHYARFDAGAEDGDGTDSGWVACERSQAGGIYIENGALA